MKKKISEFNEDEVAGFLLFALGCKLLASIGILVALVQYPEKLVYCIVISLALIAAIVFAFWVFTAFYNIRTLYRHRLRLWNKTRKSVDYFEEDQP